MNHVRCGTHFSQYIKVPFEHRNCTDSELYNEARGDLVLLAFRSNRMKDSIKFGAIHFLPIRQGDQNTESIQTSGGCIIIELDKPETIVLSFT